VFVGSLPAEIWHNFMGPAVDRLPPLGFPPPSFDQNKVYPSGSYNGGG
jgi:hypothetical protein